MKEEKKTGFSVASMVLGIIGICLSFIPIVNNVSFILGVLSVIFAMVSLVKKSGKAKAIVGLILGILSVVITLSLQNSWSKSLDDVGKDLDNMTGDNTEEILKKDVDVNIGKLNVTTDEYGYSDSEATVSQYVNNKRTPEIDKMVKIVGWYDNEIGYSSRLIDLITFVSKK